MNTIVYLHELHIDMAIPAALLVIVEINEMIINERIIRMNNNDREFNQRSRFHVPKIAVPLVIFEKVVVRSSLIVFD